MSVRIKLLVFAFLIFVQMLLVSAPEAANDSSAEDQSDDNNDDWDATYDEDGGNDPKYLISGGYRTGANKDIAFSIVSIRTREYRYYYGDNYICAGVIISRMVILTSAGCVFESKRKELYPSGIITIIAGTIYRLKEVTHSQTIDVGEIRAHPGFVIGSPQHDLALLRLQKPLVPNEFSVRVADMAFEAPEDGVNCTAAGWGQVMNLGPLADELLYINIKVWDLNECWFAHPAVTDGMICAGDFGDYDKSICRGDYGGPLYCNMKLAGIGSFGYGCGSANGIGVYTDIVFYKDWIHDNAAFRPIAYVQQSIMLALLSAYVL